MATATAAPTKNKTHAQTTKPRKLKTGENDMLIEGRNSVAECLNGSDTIDKIYIFKGVQAPELINKIKASGVKYQFVDKPTIDRTSRTGNHQGFIAFVTEYRYPDINQVVNAAYEKGNQPILLALDGIEDPHNLGNIIRTAECMGVSGIIIPKNRSASVNETVIKVASGAISHIPVCKVVNLNQEIENLKNKGFWVFALESNGVNISKANLSGPIVLVMGGENTGVHQLTLKLSDSILGIPMFGKINSLNVGAATAIALYEVNRQRSTK
jgi:23S rRNA (guanosine2251-2'-O)-methyltransferase